MIDEMWAEHGAQMYYRESPIWSYYITLPDTPESDTISAKELQDKIDDPSTPNLVCLIRNGKWTGNMISDQ